MLLLSTFTVCVKEGVCASSSADTVTATDNKAANLKMRAEKKLLFSLIKYCLILFFPPLSVPLTQ